MSPFRLGVVVNPWAGIGGATALKGSDGSAVRAEALARGAEPRAPGRMTRTLAGLELKGLSVLTWGGAMGEGAALAAGLSASVLGAAEKARGPIRSTPYAPWWLRVSTFCSSLGGTARRGTLLLPLRSRPIRRWCLGCPRG